MGQPVIHFEVVGRDGPSPRAFYSELFGWEIDTDNPDGYGLIGREGNVTTDGVGIGGGIRAGTPDYEGHVTFYVLVPDIEAALVKVESLGRTRLAGPHMVLDRVEIGAFCDAEGHMIGLVQATQP